MSQKYKFIDEKGVHLHLLWSERNQDWQALTGTTTIIDVLGKPLTWWASGLAVAKLGWTNSKIKVDGKYQEVPLEKRIEALKPVYNQIMQDDEETFLKRLDEAYKAHSVRLDESADAGTDMHAELEKYVKECIKKGGEPLEIVVTGNEKVSDFSVWSYKNVKKFIGSEVSVFNEILFIGGIIDCVAELKDGSYAIIDFKSSKDAYFSHFVQCALYDLQLSKNGAFDEKGKKLFELKKPVSKYIVFPFGGKKLEPVETIKTDSFQKAATACVEIYRQKSAFENYGN